MVNVPRRVLLRVRGRVQGVGFRFFVERQARALGLTGYVCNEDNGGVLIEAQGADLVLEQFLAAVEKGPALARVDHLNVDRIEPVSNETGFSIR